MTRREGEEKEGIKGGVQRCKEGNR